jgi:hypothetical protein
MGVIREGRYVKVLPGLQGPRWFTYRLETLAKGASDVDFTVRLAESGDRYLITAIEADELTGERLRALETTKPAHLVFFVLRPLTDRARKLLSILKVLGGGLIRYPDVDDKDLEEIAFDVVDEGEKIKTVADLYRLAYLVGMPPTATVALALGTSHTTAKRLVRTARDHHLLGETTERKAAV